MTMKDEPTGFILDEEAHERMRDVKERGSKSIRTKLERLREANAELDRLKEEIKRLEPETGTLARTNFNERMVVAGWRLYSGTLDEFLPVESSGKLRAVLRRPPAEIYAKYDGFVEIYGEPDPDTGEPTKGVKVAGVPTPGEAAHLLDRFGAELGDCSERMTFKDDGGIISVSVESRTVV